MYCRTSVLRTSKLNLLIVLATILHSNIIPLATSLRGNENLREILVKYPKYREPRSITWENNFILLMDSVEDYTRKGTKREKEEVDSFSEWFKTVRTLIQIIIGKLRRLMSTKAICIQCSWGCRTLVHYSRQIRSGPPNNIVLICKKHHIDYWKILGLNSSQVNPTYSHHAIKTGNHW